MSGDKTGEPPTIPAEQFHIPDEWANINRAPYDVISGVIYKQALNIKRVRYEPLDLAPDRAEPWQGSGAAIVRWLFSEYQDTEENLLTGAEFLFLQVISFDPGASSGQLRHLSEIRIVYCISGEGTLHHRACLGCPVVARPLREGDAALIQSSEFYNIENNKQKQLLKLFVIGFRESR